MNRWMMFVLLGLGFKTMKNLQAEIIINYFKKTKKN